VGTNAKIQLISWCRHQSCCSPCYTADDVTTDMALLVDMMNDDDREVMEVAEGLLGRNDNVDMFHPAENNSTCIVCRLLCVLIRRSRRIWIPIRLLFILFFACWDLY
jgi:hypothetical protein